MRLFPWRVQYNARAWYCFILYWPYLRPAETAGTGTSHLFCPRSPPPRPQLNCSPEHSKRCIGKSNVLCSLPWALLFHWEGFSLVVQSVSRLTSYVGVCSIPLPLCSPVQVSMVLTGCKCAPLPVQAKSLCNEQQFTRVNTLSGFPD